MKPFLPRVLRRLESWFGFRFYMILQQPLNLGYGSITVPEHLVIREANRQDLEQALLCKELDISGEFLESALARGDRCFAAFDDGKMVAYTWRTKIQAPHQDVTVSVKPPYVYAYKGLTLKTHRGLRLNPILNHAANGIYFTEGLTHFVTFTSPYNEASRRAMNESFGYEYIGYAAYGHWFGKFWLLRTPKVKRTGLRFGPGTNR